MSENTLRLPESKIIPREEAGPLSRVLHEEGKRIVFTNGVFDILHPGHVKLLWTARQEGDFLFVGVNTDESVKRLKGKDRPIFHLQARMLMLAALESVDYVVPFEEDTPLELVQDVVPDVLVKGGDYKPSEVVGADFVESRGGKLMLVPLVEDFSTSKILEKLFLNKDTPKILGQDEF